MKKHFLVLGLLAIVAVPASAEGVYIFGDIGHSKFVFDSGDETLGKSDTARGFGVGYAVNHSFSFEAAYRDFGSAISYHSLYAKASLDEYAVNASAIATLPISDLVNILGRLGVARIRVDDEYRSFAVPEDSYSRSTSKNKVFYGVGINYIIDQHLGLRAEYNRYAELQELTTSTLTFGVVYSF